MGTAAISLCLNALRADGFRITPTRINYVIWIIARLHSANCTHPDPKKRGVPIGRRDFPDDKLGAEILRRMVDLELITCADPLSHLPTKGKVENAFRRRYYPHEDDDRRGLAFADQRPGPRVHDYFEYRCGNFAPARPERVRGKVESNPAAHVKIPRVVSAALERGTGLHFADYDGLPAALAGLPPDERADKLLAFDRATAHYRAEYKPTWRQTDESRIYARDPAVQAVPKLIRPLLQSTEGRPTYELDFSNAEPRTALALVDIDAPHGDLYALIGEPVDLDREAVKGVLTALLHGQRLTHVLHDPRYARWQQRQRAKQYELVEAALRTLGFWRAIELIRRDKMVLQETGARIMFQALEESLEAYDLAGGLPLHDGWQYSPEDSEQAALVAATWARAGRAVTGASLPIRLTPYRPAAPVEMATK